MERGGTSSERRTLSGHMNRHATQWRRCVFARSLFPWIELNTFYVYLSGPRGGQLVDCQIRRLDYSSMRRCRWVLHVLSCVSCRETPGVKLRRGRRFQQRFKSVWFGAEWGPSFGVGS